MSEYKFKARPKQYQILKSVLSGSLKYGLFCGGVGSGKTATGVHFSIDRIFNNPETVGFIGANTYKQLDQSTLKAFFEFLRTYQIRHTFNTRPRYRYESKFKEHKGIVSVPNGCQIITRSLDNFEDIRGIEIGWFWIDETRDTRKEAWDVLKARLRCKKSKLLCGMLTSTPNGYDWMQQEFDEKPRQSKEINIGHGYVTSSTRENEKNLPEGYIDELESSYDKEMAEQEIEGKFVNTKTGRVYYAFDREKNILSSDYTLRPNEYIDLCVDFNVDPMKWALMQNAGQNEIVFDEFAKNNTNTPQMATAVKEKYGMHGQRFYYYLYGDYSGNFRDTRSRTTDIEIIKDILGIPESNIRIRPNPSVESRINAMNARFCNKKGERHLLISPNCINVIKDLDHVVFDDKGKIEKNTSDPVKKQLSHISDAIGYREEYEHSLKGKVISKQW